MAETDDMQPSRLAATLEYTQDFIFDFFDQNPIAQLGLIVTRDALAEKLTELGGNPSHHITALKNHSKTSGVPSLQNSLDLALHSMKHVPSHGTKEILIIYTAMFTIDPGDITKTIRALKSNHIKCSFIHLAAEIRICKHISDQTGGAHYVPFNKGHFKELVLKFTTPLPLSKSEASTASDLIEMGFPEYKTQHVSMCVCHKKLTRGGYLCPRCLAKFCEVPTECKICNLTIVSSPHLARSYHHLFPVPLFVPMPDERATTATCFACCDPHKQTKPRLFTCPDCKHVFCYDCDVLIHETIYVCPGCVG